MWEGWTTKEKILLATAVLASFLFCTALSVTDRAGKVSATCLWPEILAHGSWKCTTRGSSPAARQVFFHRPEEMKIRQLPKTSASLNSFQNVNAYNYLWEKELKPPQIKLYICNFRWVLHCMDARKTLPYWGRILQILLMWENLSWSILLKQELLK